MSGAVPGNAQAREIGVDAPGRSADARYVRAQAALCDALAELLQRKPLDAITMTELAAQAGVSRSTLYAHFGNVMDAYRATVAAFYEQTQDLSEHFSCTTCRDGHAVHPFCEQLRSAGPYRGVVHDSCFLPTALAAQEGAGPNATCEQLEAAGVPADIAEAIFRFQMSGCYAVATSEFGRRADWPRFQEALDRFIRGGMEALGVRL